MLQRLAVCIVGACFLVGPSVGEATVYNLTPSSNWYNILNGSGLNPGDEVILAAGTYSTSSRLSMNHRGTAANPIIIRAAAGASVVITRPNASQNVINLEGAQYLTLRGLEITGGSGGVRLNGNSGYHPKYLTIEDCHVHHTGDVAISANYTGWTYTGMIFRRNEIDHTSGYGEGFYLGSNNDASGRTTSVFRDGLIEENYIHDLMYTVHQGDGIEIKDGSYNNLIRNNIIHDTNYPGILVYGADGKAPNVIEGNVIWRSGDNGIQAAAEVIVRDNVVFSSVANGIASQVHQSAVPGNVTITGNTVISESGGNAIRVSVTTPSGPITVTDNNAYRPGGGALNIPSHPLITVSGNNTSGAILYNGAVARFVRAGTHIVGYGKSGTILAAQTYTVPSGGAYHHTIVDLPIGQFYRIDIDDTGGSDQMLGWFSNIGTILSFSETSVGSHTVTVTPTATPTEGDANLDGTVNVGDLAVLASCWEDLDVTWTGGDFNCDGAVNVGDLALLASNWQAGGGGAAAPEPASAAMLLAGAAVIAARRRRRRAG